MLSRDKKYLLQILTNLEIDLDDKIELAIAEGELKHDGQKTFNEAVLRIREYKQDVERMTPQDEIIPNPQFTLGKNVELDDIIRPILLSLETVYNLSESLVHMGKLVGTIRPYPVTDQDNWPIMYTGLDSAIATTKDDVDRIYTNLREQLRSPSEPLRNVRWVDVLANHIYYELWPKLSELEEHMPQDPHDFVTSLRQMVASSYNEVMHLAALLAQHRDYLIANYN